MSRPAAGTTRWWLVRHAPVAEPARIHGQADVAADTGDAVALRALADRLPLGAVWLTTHLARTRQTAAALGAVGALAEPGLAEQHFGAWQGLTHDEVAATRPEEAARFWADPAGARPPGGESFAEVVARVRAALLRLTEAYAGRDVVAVVHAGTVRAALCVALDLEPATGLRVRVDPLSLSRIDAIAGPAAAPLSWSVTGVNHPPQG